MEESAVEGIGRGVVEKLEAVEDLDGATSLDSDDATVHPKRRRRVGGGGGGVGLGLLRLDPGVVV